MVPIKVNLANPANYGGKRSKIEYIVVHYTANDGDSDEGNGNYFHNNVVNASAHYFVDGDSITQSVPDNYVAWSVGGKKYPNCGQTGGGKFYGKCTNSNSISVELCDEVKNGRYDFTEKTLENAASLVRVLMKKYGVPVERVLRHFDVTGKNCPAPMVDDVNMWKEFKERLVDEVTKYYETIQEVPTWAKPMVQEQINNGCYADKNALHLSDDMLRTMAIMKTRYYENIEEVPTWAKPMVQEQIKNECYADENALHLSDDMLRSMAIMQRNK